MLKFLFSFRGRSGRLTYLSYWLAVALFFVFIVSTVAFMGVVDGQAILILFTLYIFATIISSFAVTTRRLHDINISGWAYLLSYVFLIVAMAIVILLTVDLSKFDLADPFKIINTMSNTGILKPFLFVLMFHSYMFSFVLLLWPGTTEGNRFQA